MKRVLVKVKKENIQIKIQFVQIEHFKKMKRRRLNTLKLKIINFWVKRNLQKSPERLIVSKKVNNSRILRQTRKKSVQLIFKLPNKINYKEHLNSKDKTNKMCRINREGRKSRPKRRITMKCWKRKAMKDLVVMSRTFGRQSR